MSFIDHAPLGNPCAKCGAEAARHRVSHRFAGVALCDKCGLPQRCHRAIEYIREKDRKRSFVIHNGKEDPIKESSLFIGIDGEGQGKSNHKYIMLAACDEYGGRKQCVEDFTGLSTRKCLDFLLALPHNHKIKYFSYSFNYDLTKMLQDLDNETLYKLFRPELRPNRKQPKAGPRAIPWQGYYLNLVGTKFTIKKDGKRRVIWDLFKFYQAKFVNVCKDWKVGTEEQLKRMSTMKDKRSEFDKMDIDSVREYCYEECAFMGQLARKLVDAHKEAGLNLRNFYGAGSSGGAMLDTMGIKNEIVPVPEEIRFAVACAFFGGRFENSVIGDVYGRVYNYDISNAYPYQLYFLPCLKHGKWRHAKNRKEIENCTTALVRYRLEQSDMVPSWAPFPFRESDGTISYPISSGGGWVWLREYLAGEKLFSNVSFCEAWIYDTDCDCRPFGKIATYYLARIKLGKEGPGIVLKLGCNSCYGKLAQSVGNAVYNSWIWAGLITSGTRAQILEVLGLHRNPANLLMVATDGIYTREKIRRPIPLDTGTGHVTKPLGGWEEKVIDKGVFIARPGIYFPMSPTDDEIKDVKARGVGKGVLLEKWQDVVNAYSWQFKECIPVTNVVRFLGAKTCISRRWDTSMRGNYSYHRSEDFGQWKTRPIELSFNPMPKRSGIRDDHTLIPRAFPMTLESAPYKKGLESQDTLELVAAEEELHQQPDGDFVQYD